MSSELLLFIEYQLNRPLSGEGGVAIEYHFVDTEEGKSRLTRVYDRLFEEASKQCEQIDQS